jgi:hypothetical protein
MDVLQKVLGFLYAALRNHLSREESVDHFLRCYFDNEREIKRLVGQGAFDILGELAYDLNFFVADPARRAEDPSYYGDERLEKEIKVALRRLSEAGVVITGTEPVGRIEPKA